MNKQINTSYFDLSEDDKYSYHLEAIGYLVGMINRAIGKDKKIGAYILCF